MEEFVDITSKPSQQRESEHGGAGPIAFRRLLDDAQFASALDFVDYTVVPPGSTIGKHYHQGSEEIYFVLTGEPVIVIDGAEYRAKPNTLTVVRAGQWHSLSNDGSSDVTILVVQASIA